jgi:molecular chaperone IbpA
MSNNPFIVRTIGFDRIFQLAESALGQVQSIAQSETAYPPFNILRLADDEYRIELAVAGFSIEDIDVETKEGTLFVSGEKKAKPGESAVYQYRGIAQRAFKRPFQLADYVEVVGAVLRDGILAIDLKRDVPESKRHRKIDIETGVKAVDPEETSVG